MASPLKHAEDMRDRVKTNTELSQKATRALIGRVTEKQIKTFPNEIKSIFVVCGKVFLASLLSLFISHVEARWASPW